jgi:hypothetical protein
VPADAQISVLMLDADGRIDRDFLYFLNRVVPNGAIIIDDCVDRVRLHAEGRSQYRIDLKMRLTYLLTRYMTSKGIISEGLILGDTYFCNKICTGMVTLNLEEILAVYRELVFSQSSMTPLSLMRERFVKVFAFVGPKLLQRMRVVYRRRIKPPVERKLEP